MYSKQDIEKLVELILQVLSPEKIILFGSYATGNHKNDSDIDLMILMKEKIDRREKLKKMYELRNLFFEQNFEVDLILNSVRHFNDYKNYFGSINYSVDKEGKVLWTRN